MDQGQQGETKDLAGAKRCHDVRVVSIFTDVEFQRLLIHFLSVCGRGTINPQGPHSVPFYLDHETPSPLLVCRPGGWKPSLLALRQVPPSTRYDDQEKRNEGAIRGAQLPHPDTFLFLTEFLLSLIHAILTSAPAQGLLSAELTAKSAFVMNSHTLRHLKPFPSFLFHLISVLGALTCSMITTTNYTDPMTATAAAFSMMASSSPGGVWQTLAAFCSSASG